MRLAPIAAAAVAATVALAALPHRTASPLTDPAIAGIFDAANSWDISTGQLASTKASRPDVRAFGQTLVHDHTGLKDQAQALLKKIDMTPTPPPADFPLKLDYEATMKRLNALSGPAFDTAFLNHEVAYHKAVISAVNNEFLPSIQNPELKSFVQSAAPAFGTHLKLAENLLSQQP